MTTTVLINFAAAILSLVFRFVPSSEGWWNSQPAIVKRLGMFVMVVLSAVVIYGATCAGFLGALNWNLTCDETGLQQLLGLVFAVLVNQGTYLLVKEK